jgi:hypothetical protein
MTSCTMCCLHHCWRPAVARACFNLPSVHSFRQAVLQRTWLPSAQETQACALCVLCQPGTACLRPILQTSSSPMVVRNQLMRGSVASTLTLPQPASGTHGICGAKPIACSLVSDGNGRHLRCKGLQPSLALNMLCFALDFLQCGPVRAQLLAVQCEVCTRESTHQFTGDPC